MTPVNYNTKWPAPTWPISKSRRYIAVLNQSGTADPEATVLRNNTGLQITWQRQNVGQYWGISSTPGALPFNSASIMGNVGGLIQTGNTHDHITVYTIDPGTQGYADDQLFFTTIQITIYDTP